MNKIKEKDLYRGILFLGTVLIFSIIYASMLSGRELYAFADIGGDTIHLIAPRGHIRNHIGSGGYSFSYGFGAYIDNSVLRYILPYDFLMSLTDYRLYSYAQLLSLGMKSLIAAFGMYFFLLELTRNRASALVGGLIWTFSSYMMVWAQHYTFSTMVALLPWGLLFVQKLLEGKRSAVFVCIPVALLTVLGYYYTYMAGLFLALYVFVYSVLHRTKFTRIIDRLVQLLLFALLGILLSMYRLQESIQTFFGSTRMNDVAGQVSYDALIYKRDYLLTFLGRFFSEDLIGTGNDYSGTYNYYEAALLSTSLLLMFAIVGLLGTQYRKSVLVCVVLSCASLLFPAVSQILNMNPLKQRWTFMLQVEMVIAVAFFIKSLAEADPKEMKVRLIRTVVIADLIDLTLLFILVLAHKRELIVLSKPVFGMICAFLLIYSVILLAYAGHKRGWIRFLLYGVIFCELIAFGLIPVNHRVKITYDAWEHGYYNDGTREAVEAIQTEDPGLYRINKTYVSVLYNDAMVQGYYGLSVYDNLNPSELVEFYVDAGYELLNGKSHYVSIPYTDITINSLLGTRYVIARAEDVLDGSIFESVKEMGNLRIYRNRYAENFGYLYTTQLNQTEVLSEADRSKRQNELAYGCYLTDGSQVSELKMVHPDEADLTDMGRVTAKLAELQTRSMENISFQDNTLSGTIQNKTGNAALLAFPVIFDTHWKLYVDGESAETLNINGGLMGCIVSDGTHEIRMQYVPARTLYGNLISLITLLLFAAYLILVHKRKHRADSIRK